MLSKLEVHPAVPAQDLERAKKFYSEKLGLEPSNELPETLIYTCNDSRFTLYLSRGASNGSFTQMGWQTDDIQAEVAQLKARGLIFEEYDYPNFKTVNSIATTGPIKAAWFKDSEGNLLGLIQQN